MDTASKVALIIHPLPLVEVQKLACEMPVWLLDSVVPDQVLADLRGDAAFTVTTFDRRSGEADADLVNRLLEELEQHHGEVSEDSPYDTLQVHGVGLNQISRHAFEDVGFIRFEPIPSGFVAYKTAADDTTSMPAGVGV